MCNVHVAATVCEESGLLSTDYCPNKVSKVCVTIPAGETGETDDTYFALPAETCTVHTEGSTIIGPGTTPQNIIPLGPGYVSPKTETTIPTVPSISSTAASEETIIDQFQGGWDDEDIQSWDDANMGEWENENYEYEDDDIIYGGWY